MVSRIIILCEEPKTRFAFPTALVLQSCGREIYFCHTIEKCVEAFESIKDLHSSSICIMFPLILDYEYSDFGWSGTRKPTLVGLDYFTIFQPYFVTDENLKLLTHIYVIANYSKKGLKLGLTDLVDWEGVANQLVVKGCKLAESYVAAANMFVLDDLNNSNLSFNYSQEIDIPAPLPKTNINCV